MVKKQYSTRGRIDIMADIIKASAQGKKKYHIMAGANLTHAQLEQYLEELQEKGLLEKMTRNSDGDVDGNLYVTTARGRYFLNVYEDVKQMLDDNNVDEQVYKRYSAA